MNRSLARLATLVVALTAVAPALASGEELVFVSNRAGPQGNELYVVGRDGTGLHRLTDNAIQENQPVWSPDGARIAFDGRVDGDFDIYIVAADGSGLVHVTSGPDRDTNPRWTSTGRIVFQRNLEAWIVDADGSHAARIPLAGNVILPDPSPRGQRLAYASDQGGTWSLYVSTLDGRAATKITDGPQPFGDFYPRWSPSGNDLAFLRDDNGSTNDIWRVHANGSGLRQLTATPETFEYFPAWNGDDEILYTVIGDHGNSLHVLDAVSRATTSVESTPSAPFRERFDGPKLDSSLWYMLPDPGSTLELSGGRLVASIAGSAVPGGQFDQVAAMIGSPCTLPGDFDYQVEYTLLTWPQHGGFFTGLSAIFGDGGVARSSAPWDPPYDEQYVAWGGTNGFGVLNTRDSSGTLRLVRVAGVLHAYVRENGTGRLIHHSPGVEGETTVGISLSAQASGFGHLDGSVAFESFQLSYGRLHCPDWWSNMAADARGVDQAASVVYVPATARWVDTGVRLQRGVTYRLDAAGLAVTAPEQVVGPGVISGPEGQPFRCGDAEVPGQYVCLAPDAGFGTLVAKVGEDGPGFALGSATAFTAPASGELYLAVNDFAGYFFDNTGEFVVKLG